MNTFTVVIHLILTATMTAAGMFFAWRSADAAEDADEAHRRTLREAAKLNAMAGRVIAIEGALESLRAQHQRLSGKFHADKAERAETADTLPLPSKLPPLMALGTCENYLTAQSEGPMSEAASCECDYCVSRRSERDALRRQLPKGPHAARVRAIEAASRGQE